jgi:hypothetical protein
MRTRSAHPRFNQSDSPGAITDPEACLIAVKYILPTAGHVRPSRNSPIRPLPISWSVASARRHRHAKPSPMPRQIRLPPTSAPRRSFGPAAFREEEAVGSSDQQGMAAGSSGLLRVANANVVIPVAWHVKASRLADAQIVIRTRETKISCWLAQSKKGKTPIQIVVADILRTWSWIRLWGASSRESDNCRPFAIDNHSLLETNPMENQISRKYWRLKPLAMSLCHSSSNA